MSDFIWDHEYMHIPDGTLYLYIGNTTMDIVEGTIPDTVIEMRTGEYKLPITIFPRNLKKFVIGDYYPHPLEGELFPPCTEFIDVGCSYEHVLTKYSLPRNLKILILGDSYTHPLSGDVLPDTLEELCFSNIYSAELTKNYLPRNLKKLVLGNGYKHTLSKDMFPDNLKVLRLGERYTTELVKNSLPQKLTRLHIGGRYNHLLSSDIFPDTLVDLSICRTYTHNLTKNSFPKNLETLRLTNGMTYRRISGDMFPDSLTNFVINDNYEKIILESLPENLEKLRYTGISTKFLDSILPNNLKELVADHIDVEDNILHYLGKLEKLRIESFDGKMPDFTKMDNLLELDIGTIYDNHIIENVMSKNLRKLVLRGDNYVTKFDISECIFPDHLEYLEIRFCEIIEIDIRCLPPNLRYILLDKIEQLYVFIGQTSRPDFSIIFDGLLRRQVFLPYSILYPAGKEYHKSFHEIDREFVNGIEYVRIVNTLRYNKTQSTVKSAKK